MNDRRTIRRIGSGAVVALVAVLVSLHLAGDPSGRRGAGEAFAAGTDLEPIPTLQPALPPGAGFEAGSAANQTSASALTRTIAFNPAELTRDLTSTDITMTTDLALRWSAGSSDEAGFYMRRPPDWDDATPVKAQLYFALGGSNAGAVNWRLKLNTYTPNSGEWLTNPGTRNADAILNFADGPSWYRIYSQSFTLAPASLSSEPLWSFYFLRGSGANGETFAGDLYLLLVELEYQAVSPFSTLYLPLIQD